MKTLENKCGPERTFYTMKKPSDEITFNSIKDNNVVLGGEVTTSAPLGDLTAYVKAALTEIGLMLVNIFTLLP